MYIKNDIIIEDLENVQSLIGESMEEYDPNALERAYDKCNELIDKYDKKGESKEVNNKETNEELTTDEQGYLPVNMKY